MINFTPIGEVSYSQLVELLVPFLGEIDPELMIIGNRIQLNPTDLPFLLTLNKTEKRIGIIEILNLSKEFPGQILAHASWVAQNSYAIANLNKNEFNPDLPPFVIGLTPSYPAWQNLLSYIKLDIRLLKYTAMTYQGSPVLIFDSLFEPVVPETKQESPPPPPIQSMEEKAYRLTPDRSTKERAFSAPTAFHHEGFYEAGLTGLTEEEIRYFSN